MPGHLASAEYRNSEASARGGLRKCGRAILGRDTSVATRLSGRLVLSPSDIDARLIGVTQDTRLHYDAALALPDHDKFGFQALADQLRQNILPLLAGDRASGGFTLGLEGRWGSGKSTILNYLRLSLKAALNPNTQFVLDFDPWWLEEDANIVSALLSAVLDAMPKDEADVAASIVGKLASAAGKLPEGLDVLLSLSKKTEGVGEIVKAAREAGGDLGKILNASKPARKLRDVVAEAFAAKGFSFVVLIDDLDRLAPEQAVRVMSAIKSIADLPGFVYVLAYDPVALGNILASFKPALDTDYFEKIINVSVPVPPLTSSQTLSFLADLLSPVLRDAVLEAPVHKAALLRMLDAPRDAVRLANAVNFWIGGKTAELFLPDFLLLEAIRLSRPSAYAGILATSDIWLNTESLDFLSRVLGSTDARKDAVRKDAAARVTSALQLHDAPRDHAIRACLSALFPKAASYLGEAAGFGEHTTDTQPPTRAISDSGHFFTYFLHRPLPGAPSRSEVDALISETSASQSRRELVAEISRRPAGDVTPLHHLVALLDAERDHGNIKPSVVFELVQAFIAPTTFRRPAPIGERVDQQAVRGFAYRSLVHLSKLSDEQVAALTADELDLEVLGHLLILITSGTAHFLLKGPREHRKIEASDVALATATKAVVDRVLAAIADNSIFAVATAPHLLFMAQRFGSEAFAATINPVFEDDGRLVALVDCYSGYMNAMEAISSFAGRDEADMTERVRAAFQAVGRPMIEFSNW